MARKTGLGRGLEALIPGSDQTQPGSGLTLHVDQISPNPRQPRTNFNPEDLSELADSIRTYGVLQPLIVTESDQPDHYLLIAGERRLLAARLAGLERVPVLIREATDVERLELAIIENVQRADLNPLEEAEAFRQLAEDFGMSHEEIAGRVAKHRVTVTNTLRLLKLPEPVQKSLAEGKISEGHARALLGLSTPQSQSAVLHTILSQDLNVRQTEALVRKLTGMKPHSLEKPTNPPEINDLAARLETWLGTRVILTKSGKKGTITIYYYSDEELDALVGKLLEGVEE